MERNEWVETGRLYVSAKPQFGSYLESLWFGTNRGGGSIRVIATRDERWDPDHPVRFEDYGAIRADESPLSTDPDRVVHRLATDDDLAMFIGQMVTRHTYIPPSLDFGWWTKLGLLPDEADRIRLAWDRR